MKLQRNFKNNLIKSSPSKVTPLSVPTVSNETKRRMAEAARRAQAEKEAKEKADAERLRRLKLAALEAAKKKQADEERRQAEEERLIKEKIAAEEEAKIRQAEAERLANESNSQAQQEEKAPERSRDYSTNVTSNFAKEEKTKPEIPTYKEIIHEKIDFASSELETFEIQKNQIREIKNLFKEHGSKHVKDLMSEAYNNFKKAQNPDRESDGKSRSIELPQLDFGRIPPGLINGRENNFGGLGDNTNRNILLPNSEALKDLMRREQERQRLIQEGLSKVPREPGIKAPSSSGGSNTISFGRGKDYSEVEFNYSNPTKYGGVNHPHESDTIRNYNPTPFYQPHISSGGLSTGGIQTVTPRLNSGVQQQLQNQLRAPSSSSGAFGFK